MNQHFRGVVWPRGLTEEGPKKNYSYIVVGLLVTDKPLDNLEGKNEIVLDGHAGGIAEALPSIPQKEAACKIGDANFVIHNLKYLVERE